MTEPPGTRLTTIGRWLPGVAMLRRYERSWLRHDLVAGLVLTTLLVPQGMAYAGLAGLAPVTGLYATVAGLLVYALVGPSQILVVGPDSSLAPMIAAVIAPLLGAGADPGRAIALASTLAILTGLLCMAAGLARLGTVAELLSKPVRIGYLNGVALIIIAGQLPKLFGFVNGTGSVPDEIWRFVRDVAHGAAQGHAAAIGIGSLAIIFAFRRWRPQLPGVAIAVAGSIAAVVAFDLASRGVTVLGATPSGFHMLSIPDIGMHDVGALLVAAAGLAFVTLADTAPISRTLSIKSGDHIDPNHEMVAIGAANIAAGLLQGFPLSGSVSRTAVAEANGARTQITGVVGAGTIVAILVGAHGLLRNLPAATLGAILISAALGLSDIKSLRWLWKVRPSELLLSLLATVGVAWLGPLRGIGVAIMLAVIDFLRRAWRPHSTLLGRLGDRKGYHDVLRHPEARQAPGLVLFRFDAPLFFANADHFANTLRRAIAERGEAIGWVIIAAEPITDVDTTAAEMLGELLDELQSKSITFAVAELKGHVKDRLRVYGLLDRVGEDHVFATIGSAMKFYYQHIGMPNPADTQ
ncbi:unannotated protein [freshwater metagenome]|uniref:Unannotated protein n=1 Tax=freshwater metagenome TaxID=449393 RepID=A0A6J7FB67_9ZZZZ|nr:sulfate permease [Actinomycetota bacterium]